MKALLHMGSVVSVGAVIGLLLISGGCGRPTQGRLVPKNIERISEDRMVWFLHLPGRDGSDMIKEFGEPHERITLPDDTVVWKYWCTQQERAGYQLFFKKGRDRWSDVVVIDDATREESMWPGHVADPKTLRRNQQ